MVNDRNNAQVSMFTHDSGGSPLWLYATGAEQGLYHRVIIMERKNIMLGALLVGIAVVGPMVAYAGVTTIYPSSTTTLSVNASPPITFDKGADWSTAQSVGYVSGWSGNNNNASYDMTLSGLSGGNLTIDHVVNVTLDDSVASFKLEVSSAIDPADADVHYAVVRVWEGDTAPTSNATTTLCFLDLEGALDSESSVCTPSGTGLKIQVVYVLFGDASVSSPVSIRPTDITYS